WSKVAGRIHAYIGLGANVGDPRRTLERAVASLASLPGARLVGVSRLYRTRPVGVLDQPDFLNAVAALDLPTPSDPTRGAIDLLVALKRLERESGRRHRRRWGPRELDLDLLLYGDHRIVTDRPPGAAPASDALDPAAATPLLEVPHPSLGERLFVLAPLADLAPGLVPPGRVSSIEATRVRRLGVEGPDAVVAIGAWDRAAGAWRA
ncbi:MAG TPA: 2-amino-4-hydroxy-6-hydroxymethyldihydropteridine diphosphokinase, partial [Candidatus Limnocylindrales bacterium]|nr:2-amino-4-hydroxy-6-hydroxymethyldihydropteridine diphosphokinase [Candidatus Limnocylindrales bacterium]